MASNSYTLTGSQTSIDVASNTSYVYVKGVLTTDANTRNGYNTAYYNLNASGGGQSFSTGNINFSVGVNSTKVFEATFGPFYHNADGTFPNVTISSYCAVTFSQPVNFTRSGTVSMGTIARATACGNINANVNQSTRFSCSPASSTFRHNLSMNYNGHTYTLGSGFYNYVDFTIPSSIYQYISSWGTQQSATLTLETIGVGSKTGTIYLSPGSDAYPTLNATLDDGNQTTKDLTGSTSSNVILVTNKSTLSYTNISKGYQTYSSFGSLKNGTTSLGNVSSGSVPFVGQEATLTLTDNKGLSVNKTFSYQIKNWSKPTISATFTRPNQTSSLMDLQYSGTWWNNSFSSSHPNTLSVSWRVKEQGGTFSNWQTSTPTISGNSFTKSETSITCPLGSWNYQKQYEFEIKAVDLLDNSIVQTITVTKGIPNFVVYQDNAAYLNAARLMTLDMCYPVGSVYLTTNANYDPNVSMGGSWSRLTGNEYLRIISGSMAQSGGSNYISTSNMPSHVHNLGNHSHTFAADFYVRHGSASGIETVAGGTNTSVTNQAGPTWGNGFYTQAYSHSIDRLNISGTTSSNNNNTGSSGSGTEFNPKYYGCYAWHRDS